jgi:hypothetical protein
MDRQKRCDSDHQSLHDDFSFHAGLKLMLVKGI